MVWRMRAVSRMLCTRPGIWLGSLLVLGLALGACKSEPTGTSAGTSDPPSPAQARRRGDTTKSPASTTGTPPAKPGGPPGNNLDLDNVRPPDSCLGLERVPSRYPAAQRIVAIGDLHGDLAATRKVLALAGAIDDKDRWIGGNLVIVQTGDILDRGDDEQAIFDLLDALDKQARAAGGAVHVLNGNHELMNASGDFRYVTPAGLVDFADVKSLNTASSDVKALPKKERARAAALFPGGPYAMLLARHNIIILVGDTVFVHGGVLPEHVAYGIEQINRETRCWLYGGGTPPMAVTDDNSPVWERRYSMPPYECATLDKTLTGLGAARMVVGHTTQEKGIRAACKKHVWMIDTGLSSYYGGPVQALEIRGADVRVLGKDR